MDKRKFPRILVSSGMALNEERCPIVNITVEGVLFVSPVKFEPGTGITVVLDPIGGASKHLLDASVLRCREGADGRHTIAAKFSRPDDGYLVDILSAIHSGRHKDAGK